MLCASPSVRPCLAATLRVYFVCGWGVGASSSGGRSTTKSGGSRSDSLELDEEDQKIIDETKKMGYCYFRRDLTEEEKKINAQHRPTKVDPSQHSTTASSPVPLGDAQQAPATTRAVRRPVKGGEGGEGALRRTYRHT